MEIESSGMTPGGPTRPYQCLTVRAGANVKQVAEFQVAGLHDMMMENPPLVPAVHCENLLGILVR